MYSQASRFDRNPKHLRQFNVEGSSFDVHNHPPGEDAAQAGFTLVEVLVALALLATIGTMVFGSLVTTTHLVEAGREQATREQTVRRTLRLMADEFALSRRINGTQEGHPADTVAFLTMSDGVSRSTAKESDMIRVVYAREGDRLVRFTRTNLYGLTDESLDEVELVNQVKAFNLRYFDGQGQVWTDEWLASKMPKSLLIEITFQPSGAEPWTVREWVTIEAS